MNNILNILWIIILIQIFIPLLQKRLLAAKRLGMMRSIEKKRQSRPGVEFIPIPYRTPGAPGKGEK